ncbi:MAG TPA: hypothetical protein VG222_01790 [Vicinamibacterales bacterium]|jgi:hydroxylaminobenzene mutase|nr:hypothetical protein [Vicinamibacterales bacterium]
MIPRAQDRQGHRLIQLGVVLLLFTSFEGFVIPSLAVPRVGLSLHSLSALLAVMLPTFGLVWPRLRLGRTALRVAFGCFVYSALAIVAAYLMAAMWGAGHTTMPLAAGSAEGSAFQEGAITIVAYSSAPTGILAFGLILWGLRLHDDAARDSAR